MYFVWEVMNTHNCSHMKTTYNMLYKHKFSPLYVSMQDKPETLLKCSLPLSVLSYNAFSVFVFLGDHSYIKSRVGSKFCIYIEL